MENRARQNADGTSRHDDPNLLYGISPSNKIVFLPEATAHRLAQLRRALREANTWGDFWKAIDDDERAWLTEAYKEDEADLPSPDAPMDPDAIPGNSDGDWPAWPDQIMLAILPHDVIERFGEEWESMLSGSHMSFDAQDEQAIVQALTDHGYRCTRDDQVIVDASWSD